MRGRGPQGGPGRDGPDRGRGRCERRANRIGFGRSWWRVAPGGYRRPETGPCWGRVLGPRLRTSSSTAVSGGCLLGVVADDAVRSAASSSQAPLWCRAGPTLSVQHDVLKRFKSWYYQLVSRACQGCCATRFRRGGHEWATSVPRNRRQGTNRRPRLEDVAARVGPVHRVGVPGAARCVGPQ